MYCDGYKGRPRTTLIALVATRVGCMGTTRSTYITYVHYTFSSVLVAEWPPFGK